MKFASSIVLRVLGILLLTGAILKGWQLLTEPVANSDIWSYRPFLILTVEFELVLAIWLLSGLFKKAAWLASLLCFSLFSTITFYKGVTGAASCGCFGSVHVNPWITLFIIDLPAVITLSIFRPGKVLPPHILARIKLHRRPMKALIRQFVKPLPSAPRFVVTTCLGLGILGVTTPILALNEPAKVTSSYEVLEPETWIGKKLTIIEHIDIAASLERGEWVVIFYYSGCPDCMATLKQCKQFANNIRGTDLFQGIAFVMAAPYGPEPNEEKEQLIFGKLAKHKLLVGTPLPLVVLLRDGKVISMWGEKDVPNPEIINKAFEISE